MKFTYAWLKEFLETDAPADTVAARLTAIGLEVESMEDEAASLAPFTVAEILEAHPHPDADKLRVCKVLAYDGERRIVCGASNARAGIKVVLADIGVTIPQGGFQIKKAKIRGVESAGMLCSAEELGLAEESAGILELPPDASVGGPVAPLLGRDDVAFDVNVTPNRGDCLGVYGVARDLAASGMGTLKPIDAAPVEGRGKVGRGIRLRTPDCKHFAGRLIRGVTNGESPDWLKKRLESVGMRPISALVDITNYMTLAYGRPLHVYDADRLHGDILVRDSVESETLAALNDKTYTLPAGLCVIADEKAALGLGGVIGGTASGVTGQTRNVFLEAAWFEPEAIARAGRALGVESDARYRFERRVDPGFTVTGAEIATRMILELCGGEASVLEISGAAPETGGGHALLFSPEDVAALGGISVTDERAAEMLERLGCSIALGFDDWLVTPPSHRPDIEGRADLVEEILRLTGYDAIPETPLPEWRGGKEASRGFTEARAVRGALAARRGMRECCHFAFISRAHAERFTEDGAARVQVVNPISADLDTMRPSLLPALLEALRRGADRGVTDNALYELGCVFSGVTPDLQPMMAAGVRMGREPVHWSGKPRDFDVYDVRADLEAALDAAGFAVRPQVAAQSAPWYHPGKSGGLLLGKTVLGRFGTIHPTILRAFDLEQEVVAFELLLDNLPAVRKKTTRAALKLSDFQPSRRDFAFVVAEEVPAEEMLSAVRGAEKQLVREVTLFDVYAGKGVPEGKKSLALSVLLQAADRTLTEDDLTRASAAIIEAAAKKCGAELRSHQL